MIAPTEQLKIIASKHRWALEELVYDEKTKEWNKAQSTGAKAMFDLLKEKLGSGKAVLAKAKQLLADKEIVIDTGNPSGDLMLIAQRHTWALEEVLLDQVEAETKNLFPSANAMFRYLSSAYGSPQVALGTLLALVLNQRERRKTLHLV